jgi:diguanylate cyclase
MPVADLALRFDPGVVVLSYLTAAFASFVALDLAQRVLTPDPLSRRVWWLAGSVCLGSGIWAMHFVGMLTLHLPVAAGHDAAIAGVSWLVAVTASAVALGVAAGDRLTPRRPTLGALSMGAGICGMHYLGLAALALVLAPDMHWDWQLVAATTLSLLLLSLFASMLDARLRRRASEQQQQSLHEAAAEQTLRDPLTGLASRQLLEDRISHAIARGRRDGTGVALLMLNLDAFKPVNDSFGHAAGDTVLREVAARLQAHARGHDTLARIGADEFVLLLEGENSEAVLAQIAQRLLDSLATPMAIGAGDGSQPLRLSASIGVALHNGPDVPSRALIADRLGRAGGQAQRRQWLCLLRDPYAGRRARPVGAGP